MTRLTDARLEEIVKGNGGFLELAIMARELLLLRAECRAARNYRIRHETASSRNTTAAWLNFGEGAKAYEVASKATDDAGFAP